MFHTLQFLYQQSTLDIPQVSISNEVIVAQALVQKYLYLTLGLASFCIVAYRKNIWKVWAFLTIIPFLVGLYGSLTMLELHVRFFLNTLPATSLLLALTWSRIGFRTKRLWATCISFAFWLLLALGVIPSLFSPNSSWQHRFSASDPTFPNLMKRYYSGEMAQKSDLRHCFRALRDLELDAKPHRVLIYERE